MNRDRFYARLKDVFFPRLRSVGFTGSGLHFRRVQGEVIHAVNLQGDKYGGGCAINLGIHFTFLPIGWQAALPDEKRIKEVDCEFRRRLTSDSMADHWWRYDDASITPEQSAASLEQTYFTKGEAYFQDYGSLPAILAPLGIGQSCRGYVPFNVSHHKAPWVFKNPDNLPEPVWPGGPGADRASLERLYQPWFDLNDSGVGVHCGECGCYNQTPHPVFLAWFRDVLEVLSERGIGFGLWEMHGAFGLLDSRRTDVEYEDWYGHKLDRKLLDLLQKV